MAGESFSFDDAAGNGGNGIDSATNATTGSVSGNSSVDGNGNETLGTTDSGGSQASRDTVYAPIPKKRGRQPYPRDDAGNIIRPDGSTGPAPKSGGTKSPQLGVGFTLNNRPRVREQIQGIHTAVATLTKQPVFMLSNQEADSLTNALCDVLDFHKINLTQSSGVGGLYLVLAVTVFGVYKPKLDSIRKGEPIIDAASPSTPGEMRRSPGKIDLSGDIAEQINKGTSENPAPSMRFE